MNKYILSVVIPTRNRQRFCLQAIKQILTINDSQLQIVIQDNSDDKSLKEMIDVDIVDSRVKYNYNATQLSFVDNFSEAIALSDGEYVSMIGDDDGVLPYIMDVVRSVKRNDLDALIPAVNSVYIWPNDKPIVKNAENGYLCLSYLSSGVKKVNLDKALEKLMYYGAQKYQKLNLVKLYHGIVKKECLEKVKEKAGNYFRGLTPDIYGAVSLSLVCKRVVKINIPVTISGICNNSGSNDSATGKHTGELKDAPHFKGHEGYEWDIKIPKIYSVETIWADTALHALNNFGVTKLYEQFNIATLSMYCLKNYKNYKKIILQHNKDNNVSKFSLAKMYVYVYVYDYAIRILKRILRKKGDVIKKYNIIDIKEAERVSMDEIGKQINMEKLIQSIDTLVI